MVINVSWRRLCVSMIRKRVCNCSALGRDATSEAGKYLFRAANVWWSVHIIVLLPLVARCLETIDVCI